MGVPQKGLLIVVSAPSGAGKTSLCRKVLDRNNDIQFSISVTTRQRREDEKEGVDYYFISEKEFIKKKEEGDFAEWAEVHGYYYGTTNDEIKRIISTGNSVLLDIDVQGAQQLAKQYPDAVTIFIMPPTFDHLRKRLEERHTESAAEIEKRTQTARKEIATIHRYAYVIINDVLDTAIGDFEAIVRSAHCMTEKKQLFINNFLSN